MKNDTHFNKSKKEVSELCDTFSEIPAMKVGWVVQLMKDPPKIFPEFSFLFFDYVAKGSGKDWAQYRTLIITNGKNTFLAKKKGGDSCGKSLGSGNPQQYFAYPKEWDVLNISDRKGGGPAQYDT